MLEMTGCLTVHKEHSAVFPLTQWLCKRATYIAHLVFDVTHLSIGYHGLFSLRIIWPGVDLTIDYTVA